MTDPAKPTDAMVDEDKLLEQVAQAIAIPEHHTAWDLLTPPEQSLFRMKAYYAIAAMREAMRALEPADSDGDGEWLRQTIIPMFDGSACKRFNRIATRLEQHPGQGELVEINEPHEIFYVQFSPINFCDDGEAIRKWSRSPFEGARKCRVALARADAPVGDA